MTTRLKKSLQSCHWLSLIAWICVGGLPVLVCLAQQDGEPIRMEKVAPPSLARQGETRKSLEDTFELSKANSVSKKQQALKRLIELANDPDSAKDDLYTVLQAVIGLSKGTGDFSSFHKAVEQLYATYNLDADKDRSRHFQEFLAACKSANTAEPAIVAIQSMVAASIAANRYQEAIELLMIAERHAKRLTASKFIKSLAELRAAVRKRQSAFEMFTASKATLAAKPDDAQANFVVGQWEAAYEGNWGQAVPKLSKGSDVKWKAAADADSATSAEVETQLKTADLWWEAAQASSDDARLTAQRRADFWYEQCEAIVKNPLAKARVLKRREELAVTLKANSAIGQIQPQQKAKEATNEDVVATGALPVNKSVNLIPLIKLPDHSILGSWEKRSAELHCGSSQDARCMAPVSIRGSYDLDCEFTRTEGNFWMFLVLPVGPSYVSINVGGPNGDAWKSKTVLAEIEDVAITNGKKHSVHVEVVQTLDHTSVLAEFNGKRFLAWQGDPSSLPGPAWTAIPYPQSTAIGFTHGVAVVHKWDLRIKKNGKAYHLGDDWKNPLKIVAESPPKEIAGKCITWDGRKYFLSSETMNWSDAQRLAEQLRRRMLTVSSAEEEKFIYEKIKGPNVWLSAWRRSDERRWRDERNKVLEFMPKWYSGRPGFGYREQQVWLKTSPEDRGLIDGVAFEKCYACIEWGEE